MKIQKLSLMHACSGNFFDRKIRNAADKIVFGFNTSWLGYNKSKQELGYQTLPLSFSPSTVKWWL